MVLASCSDVRTLEWSRSRPLKGTLQGFGTVTLEGLPFKPPLEGGFKGALKRRVEGGGRRGLTGVRREEGRGTKVKP